LTAHIDGDAFFGNADFDPSRTTGEVIRDEIIKVFKIPHTVSIIEAEVAPWGLYPEKSKKLEEVAKSIFSLPNVEPASHSFSHPFMWRPEIRPPKELKYGFHLPVKGYKFNPRREVFGSLNYINNLIKDLGKRVRVFLWTGECNPSGETVRLTYLAKVYNVNGGDTTITRESPFLKNVSPSGVNFGPYFQVYAPMQNENVYTNLWSNPFWGYIKVIQTFELTDKPYRLKPISIYYHFYSGQKLASLNALKKVYRYALSQEVIPMYLSEYARKVLEFRHTAILKDGKAFVIKNDGVLRTLRVPSSFGFPDLKKSKGVVGYRKIGNNIYVHLDDSGYYRIYFTKKEPKDAFRLVFSNGKVKNFLKIDNKISFELRSYISLSAKIFAGNCRVFIDGKEQRKKLIDLKKEKKYAKIEAICTN
ncbi:MAG: polysaccharide deacetylase, partial [Aquifex sp.]